MKRPSRAMLSVLTKSFRVRAATVVAALYALCSIAPASAFAFSNNPAVSHCLIEGHIGVHNASTHDHGAAHDHGTAHEHGGAVHVHADGSAHQHHDDGTVPQHSGDDDKARVASCCGLFSVVAIAGEPSPSLGLYSLASVVLPVVGDALSGRGPERINRPPIS
jgi:hypothetical protein